MISVLKRKIKQALSPAQKLFAKRLFVGSVRNVMRAAAHFYRLADSLTERAIEQGLDWHRAWDVKAKPSPSQVPPFGVRDLMFLRDLLSDDSRGTPLGDLEIRTSIVIPAFNHAEFTFQCLRSLLREANLRTTEIIVVNDASTDETSELLVVFGNHIRVVNNQENIGFGETCNRGAAVARGRYLVFLNNDTWVLPGWLDELEKTVEDNPAIGAVGSMFLYPDGRIQEAGAIVWRSGSAFHYGWGKSADDRRFNFAREVDYCSAASLLVRKEIFDRLGGFDRRYSPAYYEDTDLCMGVRSLGYKVVYQPASRLIHYEGVTAGRDVRSGLKKFQVINRSKFEEKWHETLEYDHSPDNPGDATRAADRRGMSLLVIDDHVPTPDRDAGSARMALILKSLAERYRPVFVSVSKQALPEYERQLWKIGVETISVAEYPRLMRVRKFTAAIVSRPDVAEAVIPFLRRRHPPLKIIFDQVDAHFIRLDREYLVTGDPHVAADAAAYKRIESRVARMADLIWCNSTEDERVMNALVPNIPSVVVPTIHSPQHQDNPFDEREGLLFLGNMAHRPNADATHFLVHEIMPLVRRDLPDVRLDIVGELATIDVTSYASTNVRFLGYVPDIDRIFAACRLMVVPLRFGAGIKGKVGESLAHGLPVVTTSIGAESMGISHEKEAMIADTPQDLAASIVRVYSDRELWGRLARGGQHLIEANFTPDLVERVIDQSLRDLGVCPE